MPWHVCMCARVCMHVCLTHGNAVRLRVSCQVPAEACQAQVQQLWLEVVKGNVLRLEVSVHHVVVVQVHQGQQDVVILQQNPPDGHGTLRLTPLHSKGQAVHTAGSSGGQGSTASCSWATACRPARSTHPARPNIHCVHSDQTHLACMTHGMACSTTTRTQVDDTIAYMPQLTPCLLCRAACNDR